MHISFGRIFAAAVVAVGYAAGAAQSQERMAEGEDWRAVKPCWRHAGYGSSHRIDWGCFLGIKLATRLISLLTVPHSVCLAGMYGDLFPKGSDAGSRLEPEFFDEEVRVASIIEALQAAGKNLATAAAAGDMAGVRQNLGVMGHQCGAGHKQYRANQS